MSWSYTMTAYLLITALWKTCLSLCSEEIVYFLDIVWIHYCSIIGELKYWRSIPFLPCTLPPKRNIANNSQLNVNLNSAALYAEEGKNGISMNKCSPGNYSLSALTRNVTPVDAYGLLPAPTQIVLTINFQLSHGVSNSMSVFQFF